MSFELSIPSFRVPIACGEALSDRALHIAAIFGLDLSAADDHASASTILPACTLTIPNPGVMFITGPSGGGKSTLLRAIAAEASSRNINVIHLNPAAAFPDRPLIDQLGADHAAAAALLALAGLGEAALMLRRPPQLSDGQRHRLALAIALAQASSPNHPPRPAILIADEFGASLDRLTAQVIAASIRQWISRTQVTLVAATTHDDLLEPLDPDVLVHKGLGDELRVIGRAASLESSPPWRRGSDSLAQDIVIHRGTLRDCRALWPLHYRSHHPGAVAAVFIAVHRIRGAVSRFIGGPDEPAVAGAAVISMPALACSLRDVATRGRYTGLDRRAAAAALNREVRTISRVIVDPRYRGLGLAVRLVRHALANPADGVIFTEALAAMGRVNPFFERAGMTRYDRPPHAADARLLEALAALNIQPLRLLDRAAIPLMVQGLDQAQREFLARELRRRDREDRPLEQSLHAAARSLLSQPVYYLHQHGHPLAASREPPLFRETAGESMKSP